MTDKERFIPTLEKLAKKLNALDGLTKDEKSILTAMLSNQIHIQTGSAEIVDYDDVDLYSFSSVLPKQRDYSLK